MRRSPRRAGWLTACLTLVVCGCATPPSDSAALGEDAGVPKTLVEWELCAKSTAAALERGCEEKGIPVATCFGAGGAGLPEGILQRCGSKPARGLSREQREALKRECASTRFDDLSQVTLRYFYDFAVGSAIWNIAKEECDRIYAVNADKRNAGEKRTADRADARSKPMNIERAYQASSDYVGVVIRTNEARRVKCALLNGEGDYLRVEDGIVTPPADEILIRSGGITWDSVRCWY